MNPKYGITGPVTLEKSSDESIKKTEILIKYLHDSDFFESDAEAETRERVLGKLDFLVKQFVSETAPKGDGTSYGGKIFTFGSYRLGVHDKGADIDALCVVPRHVTRKDFFSIFYDTLTKDENIKELSKIEDAYVPLIKMKYHGIPIDLTMARINAQKIDDKISLLNDSVLKSMDEKCILSLNGSRVTDAMLSLVPNTASFHTALRAIKFWAKRRFIYGNTYGYFGGVAFSISTARICQMYPNYCGYDILVKFFEVYADWKWPSPVLLKNVIDHNYNMKVWDPSIHISDKYHKMPVITPVYPSMCSTHNITQSTFNLIISEISRASEIIKKCNVKNNCGNENYINNSFDQFKSIFDGSPFFKTYKTFISVTISGDSTNFKSWEGFIESKIRILSTKLEITENISAAIPFPRAFKAVDDENNLCSTTFFIAVELQKLSTASKKIYVDAPIREFIVFCNDWAGKGPGMKIEIKSKTKKDTQVFLRDFFK